MAALKVDPRLGKAMELWNDGYRSMMEGDLEVAIEYFSRSIEICPTAEAYTFRGWAYSFQGKVDDAIAECRKAISVDPEFGNPYNDIGSYLIAKGDLDDAIPWLEKAKLATRYEPRHFPYINLGRVYAAKGLLRKSLDEFRRALELHPDDETAVEAIETIQKQLN